MLQFIQEMDVIEKESPDIGCHLSQMRLPEIKDGQKKVGFDSATVMFSFLPARCTGLEFLSELIAGLREVPVDIRNRMLASSFESVSSIMRLVDRAWLAESRKDQPDWDICVKVLEETIVAAREFGVPKLGHAAARGAAIVYEEYLKD